VASANTLDVFGVTNQQAAAILFQAIVQRASHKYLF
jgi:hypothetical protein